MTALAAARERALPGLARHGLAGRPRARSTASADVHESVTRAAELLGIGRDRVRAHPDRRATAACAPSACAAAIDADRAAGVAPVAVVATAGTTLTGAVDPLDALADVCERARRVAARRRRLRAAGGARREPRAALRGPRARRLGDASTRTSGCSCRRRAACCMVREAEWLERAFTHDATYVPARAAASSDAVDRTLEYSRPFRALKLWLALRVHGAGRLPPRDRAQPRRGAPVRRSRQGAPRARAAAASPSSRSCRFRHVATDTADLDEHNRALAAALRADGRVYVSGRRSTGARACAPCFVNFRTTDEQVDDVVGVIRELGGQIRK